MNFYDDIENQHHTIINIIFICFTIIFILISITICLIHIKQPFLRQGFFTIVFAEAFLELLTNIIIFLTNILSLSGITKGKWFIIFPLIFNFSYVGNIIYNILALTYLISVNKEKDETTQYDARSQHSSISLSSHSFKSFHAISIIITSIHTFLYGASLILVKYANKEKSLNFEKSRWIFYFYEGNENLLILFIFGFNFVYFILSIPYFITSYQNKITNHIFLKRYSIYCIFSGVVSLLFPISITLNKILNDVVVIPILYINVILFFVYLTITSLFRLGCYYIQFILSRSGESFLNKVCFGLKILFKCQEIPQPNFIDFNSTFVYHSLASSGDFMQEMSRTESFASNA